MTPAMLDAARRLKEHEDRYAPHPSGAPLIGWMDDFMRDDAAYRKAARDFWMAARQYAEMQMQVNPHPKRRRENHEHGRNEHQRAARRS